MTICLDGQAAERYSESLDLRKTAFWRARLRSPNCSSGLPLSDHLGEYDLGRAQVFADINARVLGIPDVWILRRFNFAVTSPVVDRIDPPVIVAPAGLPEGRTIRVPVLLQGYLDGPRTYRIEFEPAKRFLVDSMIRDVTLTAAQGEIVVDFEVPVREGLAAGDYPVRARVLQGTREISKALGVLRLLDVALVADLRVGVIQSYDDTLDRALQQLGIRHELLDASALEKGDLSRFDTICVDIRAYAKRQDLRDHNKRLLDYAHAGGNLVVFYNKTYEWNPEEGHPAWAPYPIHLSRDRVTVESAPIRILDASHPLLMRPNRLGSKDWAAWVQERGLYFPDRWAKEYTALLSSNDPGEPPLDGGYLAANYGKGTYLYTSYVWYRQLREGHPGCYRAFVNMLSWGKM